MGPRDGDEYVHDCGNHIQQGALEMLIEVSRILDRCNADHILHRTEEDKALPDYFFHGTQNSFPDSRSDLVLRGVGVEGIGCEKKDGVHDVLLASDDAEAAVHFHSNVDEIEQALHRAIVDSHGLVLLVNHTKMIEEVVGYGLSTSLLRQQLLLLHLDSLEKEVLFVHPKLHMTQVQ